MNYLFEKIAEKYNLSPIQKNQYENYIHLLLEENKKYNLTAISTLNAILSYHLEDTLRITKTSLLNQSNIIADIGSGCGVPGILLAIYYPEKSFYLIEVTNKKIQFLSLAIAQLNLSNCTIITDDFLTCIRKKEFPIDTFIARASLGLKEITKIYLIPFYYSSRIIYWGSSQWKEDPKHNTILKNKLLAHTEYKYDIQYEQEIRHLNYIHINKVK
jgi:16S rRNA (guanine527-N7)-methyltransferase